MKCLIMQLFLSFSYKREEKNIANPERDILESRIQNCIESYPFFFFPPIKTVLNHNFEIQTS